MIRPLSINPRKIFPGMMLFSLGLHFAIFSNIIIAFPDKTNQRLPTFSFIGSILTEQDFLQTQKRLSTVTRLHTLPENLMQKSKKISDERSILKPNYSPQFSTDTKIDYKPDLNAVNPKEKEREANTEKLLGVDITTP